MIWLIAEKSISTRENNYEAFAIRTTGQSKWKQKLQNGNPRELVVLGKIKGDDVTRKALHKKFKHLHIRNGWYKADPAILGEFT